MHVICYIFLHKKPKAVVYPFIYRVFTLMQTFHSCVVFGVFLTFSFIFTTGQASGWVVVWWFGLGGSLSVSSFYGNLLRKYHLLINETLISFIEFRSKYSWYEGKWENKAYLVSCSVHIIIYQQTGACIYATLYFGKAGENVEEKWLFGK